MLSISERILNINMWITRIQCENLESHWLVNIDRILKNTINEIENIWYHSKMEPWLYQHKNENTYNMISFMILYLMILRQEIYQDNPVLSL